MSWMRTLGATGVALASVTVSAPAAAAESDAPRCVAAAERGQKERDDGRLVESRATFASCGEVACPAVVRRECLRWLSEVDERLPTIVISLKDRAGKDVLDADVTIDRERLAAAARGRELRLDPGQHRIAARRGHGDEVAETVLVREREKGRTVSLVLDVAETSPSAPAETGRSVPVFTWVLAGTAALGGASFAYFWSRGVGEVHDLRSSCAPRCSQSDIDHADDLLRISHLSLGVGIAAAVGAVVVYLLRSEPSPRRAAFVSPLALPF